MTNTTGKLALFWRFSITASSLPSRLTDHYSLATRFTSHRPRSTPHDRRGPPPLPRAELGTALPTRARFNDGRFRVTTEAQLRARARFIFTGHWPL